MQTKIIIVGDREYGDIDTAKKLYRREREREYISRKKLQVHSSYIQYSLKKPKSMTFNIDPSSMKNLRSKLIWCYTKVIVDFNEYINIKVIVEFYFNVDVWFNKSSM